MVQKSELLKKARSRERSPQTSGVRIPSRLSEPAEDLASTNAAYLEDGSLPQSVLDCK